MIYVEIGTGLRRFSKNAGLKMRYQYAGISLGLAGLASNKKIYLKAGCLGADRARYLSRFN